MAKTIPDLSAAITPLSGGDLFELSQLNGTYSSKVSVDQITTKLGDTFFPVSGSHADLNNILGKGEYHLSQEASDQIDSTSAAITFSGGISATGHSQIGATNIDYPGFPTYEALLRLRETFGSGITAAGYGLILDIDTDASNALAQLVGITGNAQLNTPTSHSLVEGGKFFGNQASPSASVTDVIGVNGLAGGGAEDATVTNMIGGDFGVVSSFSIVNSIVTNLMAGQFQVLKYGSGALNTTNAYGILIKAPGFTPTGTKTNLYGLYIENQEGFDNNYNLYSAGASASNKFEGHVTVDGNLNVSGAIYTPSASLFIGNTHVTSEGNNVLKINALPLATENYVDTELAATSASIVTSGVTIVAEWSFSTSTGASDPGSGRFRFDNAIGVSASNIYIDDFDRAGVDMGLLISTLDVGDLLYIQQKDDSGRAFLFEISASASDNVGWWTIPVQNGQGSGIEIENNKRCSFIFHHSGAPVVHSQLLELTAPADDHTQYAHIDGRRAFTNPVSGQTPTEDAHLATKAYVDTPPVTAFSDYYQMTTSAATPAHREGLFSWDNVDHTLRIFNNISAMAIQVGQEQLLPVRNETGSQIDNGKPLYLSGVSTSNGTLRILVDLAQANDPLKLVNPVVSTHNIANNEDGYATITGFVRDIDTSGLIPGRPIFVSAVSAGEYVQTVPLSPNRQAVIGLPLNSHATSGAIWVNPALLPDKTQVIVYSLPLTGVTDTVVPLTGTLRSEATGATATVSTPWALSNQHAYILVNSITGSGTVTVSGSSLSETTAVPVSGSTETIPGVSATGYYQTNKKWWDITDITISPGISAINYDYGVVGYPDLGNRDFVILGYRFEGYSAGVNPDIRLIIQKIQDDGNQSTNKKMSVVTIEDIGVDSDNAGNQIIDNIRTGADDRSYNPTVASIWDNDTQLVFKQLDFNDYFSNDENVFDSSTKNEGFIIRMEGEGGGISNVDFVTLHLYFQIL